MNISKIKIADIYKLFFCKNLTAIKINRSYKSKRTSDINNITLTPTTKLIYNATSPKSKSRILRDLRNNNAVIESIESKIDLLDPDYQEKFQNNGLGFFMEDYICAYAKCPVCGQPTLCKYSQSNVPVVDIVCTNSGYHLEKNNCFIFQLKISLTDNYFSKKNQILVVGSKNYGSISHIQSGHQPIQDKIIVPGYICIKLKQTESIVQEYMIDYSNSFILIPNYQNRSNDNYYEYLDISSMYGKNILSWNNNMVDITKLNNILTTTKIKHEVFEEEIFKNPYCDLINILN